MDFVQLISTCKCSVCGMIASCARVSEDTYVCRGCNPENWERSAEIEKDYWLNGSLETGNE